MINKSKKAQGLSMSTIVIAAIALLVLVILATFLLRSGGDVGDATSCTGMGGTCDYANCEDASYYEDGSYVSKGQSDCSDGSLCCVKLI